MHKDLAFVYKQVELNDQGRYVFLYASINIMPCIIENVYIPLPYISEALERFIQFWMGKQGVPTY